VSRTAVHNANSAIEERLNEHALELEEHLGSDVLSFVGPIVSGVDDVIREAVEARVVRRRRLAVIVETDGGYIEVTPRIADTLRRHYRRVEFIVPNHAMSAGTVLVMAGDAIHMDYYSVLGPIDPQVQRPGGGGFIPALGYLVQYERLMQKAVDGKLNSAELTLLVQKYDPAELYRYEQARQLSVTLLKEWLTKFKFKNWKTTKSRGLPVTPAMRERRAEEVAHCLNDTGRWHSHGRGISMQVLRQVVKVEIEDFGQDKDGNRLVRGYHRLLVDYMRKLGHSGALHWTGHYTPFMVG